MRLLNKKEIQDVKIAVAKENDAIVIASGRKIKEFQDKIAKLNLLWEQKQNETAIFISNAECEKQKLQNEIASLEERRQKALAPITSELAVLEAKKEEIESINLKAQAIASENRLENAKIASKSSQLAKKESELNEKEHKLEAFNSYLKGIEENLKTTEKELNEVKNEFDEYRIIELEAIERQKNINAQDLSYIRKMTEIQEEQRNSLMIREMKLEDRQRTLKLAFDEYNKKTGK